MSEKNIETQTPQNEREKKSWDMKHLLLGGLIVVLFIGSAIIFHVTSGSSGGLFSGSTGVAKKQVIFFTRDGTTKLFSVLEDGSDLKCHLDESFGDKIFHLIAVKDGSSAAFVSDKRTAYLIEASSNDKTELAEDVLYSIAVSPDGETLFYSDDSKNFIAMKIKNKQVLWKRNYSDILISAFFSHDGKSIYLVFDNFDHGAKSTLYKLDASKGEDLDAVGDLGPYASNAKLSPDGKKVAFIRNGSSGGVNLELFDMETKDAPSVVHTFDKDFTIHSWSKDSSKIFLSVDDGAGKHLHAFDLDKKEFIAIKNDGDLIPTD